MRDSTKDLHDRLAALGVALGFTVGREVTNSLLALRLDDGYEPRIDLLWSLPLDDAKRDALAFGLGRDVAGITHMPVVGIEVEGTDPTTKTLQADVANLLALGAPLGLVVTSEQQSPGIYRRSARVIRTIQRTRGAVSVVPVEATWLDALAHRQWSTTQPALPDRVRTSPRGGETAEWAPRVRALLRDVGLRGGFVVAEPLRPAEGAEWFAQERDGRKCLSHVWDPTSGELRPIEKAADYITASEIDLGWLLALPPALGEFLAFIAEKDPTLRDQGLLFPGLWATIAPVGFELETEAGKHAAGGLLNLAAYCALGVAIASNEEACKTMQRTLRTYAPTLGLRNVVVRNAADLAGESAPRVGQAASTAGRAREPQEERAHGAPNDPTPLLVALTVPNLGLGDGFMPEAGAQLLDECRRGAVQLVVYPEWHFEGVPFARVVEPVGQVPNFV